MGDFPQIQNLWEELLDSQNMMRTGMAIERQTPAFPWHGTGKSLRKNDNGILVIDAYIGCSSCLR